MDIERFAAVVDTHTGGEPTRLIVGGGPLLKGSTITEKWLDFKKNHDDFRAFVMCEPHGHADMFGALLVPACHEEAHYGIIFMDAGTSISMCGHGSIGLGRTLVDLGMIKKTEPYTDVVLDTPAGLVRLKVEVKDGVVGDVILSNVPAFAFARDIDLEVPSLGRKIHLDISYGGNFFAIVPAGQLDLEITATEAGRIVPLGLEILRELNRTVKVQHPVETAIDHVALVEFSLERPGQVTRNTVVWGEGSHDRSPCGTGTCAKMALLAAKGKLAPGEKFMHESITDSLFEGWYEPGPKVGGFDTVLPFLKSRSYVTGFNFLMKQPGDKVGEGFLLKR
jgi:proline racemase